MTYEIIANKVDDVVKDYMKEKAVPVSTKRVGVTDGFRSHMEYQ